VDEILLDVGPEPVLDGGSYAIHNTIVRDSATVYSLNILLTMLPEAHYSR
jgi:hypothetical protein